MISGKTVAENCERTTDAGVYFGYYAFKVCMDLKSKFVRNLEKFVKII